MKIATLLVGILTLLINEASFAQVQDYADEFRYDNSGNRIRRNYKISLIALRQFSGEEHRVDTLIESLNQENPAIKVYPNPTSDRFFVESQPWTQTENVIIRILDVNGAVKHAKLVEHPIEQFSLQNNPPGTYLVQYFMDNRLIYTWKVIKF